MTDGIDADVDDAGGGPIFTIGHSTHAFDRFLHLLRVHGITGVADVRRFPGSRRHPHFAREALARSLPMSGIEYRHLGGLGGRRSGSGSSANGGWTNPSFRTYADHMSSEEFREAIDALLAFAARRRVAIMCAEGQPWRCHRQLIADALVARSVEVLHVLTSAPPLAHQMTAFARVDGSRIVYPAAPAVQQSLRAAD
jgi:uncharacterized protein (DUF488 family)